MNPPRDPRLPTYPMLKFAQRHRRGLPWAAALVLVVAGGWAATRTGAPDFLLAGVLLAPIAHGITRGLLELVELVAELLIPE